MACNFQPIFMSSVGTEFLFGQPHSSLETTSFVKVVNNVRMVSFGPDRLPCNGGNVFDCLEECKRGYSPEYQRSCSDGVGKAYGPFDGCFIGESKVFVPSIGSWTLMRDLEIGTEVLDVEGRTTRVVGWLHCDPKLDTTYMSCWYSCGHDQGESMFVSTPHHIVLNSNDDSSSEYQTLTDADTLLVTTTSGRIQRCKIVRRELSTLIGAFAPLTSSGTILVDNVACSCFASPFASFEIPHDLALYATWFIRTEIIPRSVSELWLNTMCFLAQRIDESMSDSSQKAVHVRRVFAAAGVVPSVL